MTMTNAGVTFSVSVKELQLEKLDGTKVHVAFLVPEFQSSQPQPQRQTPITGAVHLNAVALPIPQTKHSATIAATTPSSGAFKCYNCPKTFSTNYMLKRHEPIHHGAAFPCLELNCGTAFRNQTTLTKHLIVAHGFKLGNQRRPKKEIGVKRPARGRQTKEKKPAKKTVKKPKRMPTPSPPETSDEDNDTDRDAATDMEFGCTPSSGDSQKTKSSSGEIEMSGSPSSGEGSATSSEIRLRFAVLEETSEQGCPSSPTLSSSPTPSSWHILDSYPLPEQRSIKIEDEEINMNESGYLGLDLEMDGWNLEFPEVIFEDLL